MQESTFTPACRRPWDALLNVAVGQTTPSMVTALQRLMMTYMSAAAPHI